MARPLRVPFYQTYQMGKPSLIALSRASSARSGRIYSCVLVNFIPQPLPAKTLARHLLLTPRHFAPLPWCFVCLHVFGDLELPWTSHLGRKPYCPLRPKSSSVRPACGCR